MASKQRGKKTTGAPASHKEEMEQSTDLNMLMFDSSDDDGAPDEVTFEDSKATALQSMRDALQAANREKERLKEKRRKKHELFQEQKKRRLLPIEVLEEISAPPSKKPEVPGDKVEEEGSSEEEDADDEEADGAVEEESTDKTEQKYSRTVKGSYTVTTTTRPPAMSSSQQQSAVEFLQNRMYGSKNRRTTSNELLSLGVKRGESNINAMQFINKDWGYKHKANAEKFKKRWLHKQKLQSS